MFKTIQIIVMAALCLNFNSRAQSPKTLPLPNKQAILGKVISSTTGEALPGAVIKVTAPNHTTVSNDKGEFILTLSNGTYNISISHLGYKTKSFSIQIPLKEPLVIALESDDKNLQEVEIVSTGYQNIPKERATGSFTTIDEKTLNRSVGINILDRLEGVTSGLLSNVTPFAGNSSKISIHGRSTLFSNDSPLIVLNGFPYEGTIDQINPADIESINLLKDAAASSIWGSKSGNGVIVITTKSGQYNQKMTINTSLSFSLSNKPDLFYIPQMSSSDFIDLEQYLFSKGMYNSRFSNPYNAVSTAVEIFNQRKNNRISATDSMSLINNLKLQDVRNDIDKYMYRRKLQQQYQLNIAGGTSNYKHYISAGYDKNLEDKVFDSYSRLTLNATNTYSVFKEKLKISGDMYLTSSQNNTATEYRPNSPYDLIADENGNSLPVVLRSGGFRMSYLDTVGNGKLLDWHYRPKDEFSPSSQTKLNQYRLKAGITFKIIEGLEIAASYQFLKENSNAEFYNDVNSYYTRNLINKYSSIVNGTVNRVIPAADILSQSLKDFSSKVFRGQVNFSRVFREDHEVTVIAGYEGSDSRTGGNSQIYYGYDPETLTHANATINPLSNYKYYYSSASSTISTSPYLFGSTNINQSYYVNGSYAYSGRYIVSGSARRDESNLFGVKTNQKGVPLWSLGFAWNIDKESFYALNWLPSLKLRTTYGYNGNVDNSVSAYLTSNTSGSLNYYRNPYARIINPPNPSLRWEKVKTWNFGVDFSVIGNRIDGSIDLYQKKAVDLIGNNPIAFQTGIEQFRGNGASLITRGLDLVLNSLNVKAPIKWRTSLLINYNLDKVDSYKVRQSSNSNLVNGNYQNPLEGYPYNAVFSFPSAGLDNTGAPQGYLDGVISKDYTKIIGTLDASQIKYHGSALPKYFGNILNTFSYKQLELTFNIGFKFDYYFRRSGVFTGSNYGTAIATVYEVSDFENRWQKPGDEHLTKIPALVYPNIAARSTFFQLSEDLVEKGDHIRLQDVRFSYSFSDRDKVTALLKRTTVFLYTRNLGILWRQNNLKIDPDYRTSAIPQPFSASIGINLTL
jgi:TonB-linked SusC/RagA family outer membrane protein